MTFVGFAQSRHPELEQPDVVLLSWARGPQDGKNLLGVLPPTPVHFGELEQHFDLTGEQRLNCKEGCLFFFFFSNSRPLHSENLSFHLLHPLFF